MSSQVPPLLDLLPVNVETILRHLDEDASKEAALICQDFHEHICYLRGRKSQIMNLCDKVSCECPQYLEARLTSSSTGRQGSPNFQLDHGLEAPRERYQNRREKGSN